MDLASLISHPAPAVKSNRGDYFSASTSYKRTAPQPPLSPPAEEQPKCSLPSISTLIESADSAPARPASMTSILAVSEHITDACRTPEDKPSGAGMRSANSVAGL